MNLSITPLKNISFGNDAWKIKQNELGSTKSLATLAKEQDRFERMDPDSSASRFDLHNKETHSIIPSRKNFNKGQINNIKKLAKAGDYDSIFELCGIEVLKTKNGKKVISCYKQPSDSQTFKNLGVDEKELLKDVIAINGDAIFAGSALESTGQIRSIYGDLLLKGSNINDASSIKKVNGNVFLPDGATTKDINLNPDAVMFTIY